MADLAAQNEMTDAERELERLRFENDRLTKGGIIEVAVRNSSVSDYMREWEGRALKAEQANDALVKALTELRFVGNDMAKRKAARAKADAALATLAPPPAME